MDKTGMALNEAALPISEEVKGACEILRLDPLYVANEGKLIALVPAADLLEGGASRRFISFSSHPEAPREENVVSFREALFPRIC